MRLFFASCFFPPTSTARAMQVSRLARALPLHPAVVCADLNLKEDKELEPEIDDIITVKRIPLREHQRSLAKRLARVPVFHTALDEWAAWVRPACRWLLDEKISAEDVLTTFSMPMSSQMTGLKLKKKTGVRWIAHFSDPWLGNPYFQFSKLQHFQVSRTEKQIFQHADRLIFTNEEVLGSVMARFPESYRSKASVLHHYFDESARYDRYLRDPDGPYIFRYTGKFYGPRTEKTLVSALAVLLKNHPGIKTRIRFEFVGCAGRETIPDNQRFVREGLLSFPGRVSYPESLRLMGSAAALVSVDAPVGENLFLPSKIADYLGSRRPILGIAAGTSPTASAIRKLGGFVGSPSDPESIARAILDLVAWLDANGEKDFYQPAGLEEYSLSRASEKFMEIVNSVAKT